MADRAYPDALPAEYRLHWYLLTRVLGQGGFGITYLARDTNLDQMVAIKEFLPVDMATRLADSTVSWRSDDLRERYRWGLERFIQEARTLARFDHPNIVRVHSVFEANATAYMVMRFEDGQNLAAQLERRGTLPEPELQRILLSILDGLELVHKSGFIHRDIKPDNIHIRLDGSPVLLDFGSARHSIGKARTMTILVAPGYAPLEQYYSDSASQGPWTDIYGLAATCYRAIAGIAPIDAIARSKGILGSADDVLVPASVIGRGRYSERLLTAIDHGLAFSEQDRPQSIADWRKELIAEPTSEVATRQGPPVAPAPALSARAASPQRQPTTEARGTPGNRRFPFAALTWSVGGAVAAGVAVALMLGPLTSNPDAERRMAEAQQKIDAMDRKLREMQSRAEQKPVPDLAPRSQASEESRPPEQSKSAASASSKQSSAPPKAAPPTAPVEPPLAKKQEAKPVTPVPKPIAAPSGTTVKPEPVRPEVAVRPPILTDHPEAPPPSSAPRNVSPPVPTPAESLAEAERLEAGGDHAGALVIFRGLAAQGNARAQAKLGDSFRLGRGTPPDPGAAAGWYQKAAEQGDPLAQFQYGQLLASGSGKKQSLWDAYFWLSLAARAGVTGAEAARREARAQLQPAEVVQADAQVEDFRRRNANAR
jgi:serine/threonine protein kinase